MFLTAPGVISPTPPYKRQGSTVLSSRQLWAILKPQSLVFLLLVDNFHFPSYTDSKPQDDRGYILQLNVFWLTSDWPYRFLLEQTRRERREQNLEWGREGAATSSTDAVFLAVDASLVQQKRGCACFICPWVLLWLLWLLDHACMSSCMTGSHGFYRIPIPPRSETKTYGFPSPLLDSGLCCGDQLVLLPPTFPPSSLPGLQPLASGSETTDVQTA